MATTPYITRTNADTYFTERYPSDLWDAATNDTKDKILIVATKIIDTLNFFGEKTNSSQEREFPRDGDTEVPQDILDACCEIAYALLDGVDIEKEYNKLMISSTSLDVASITFNNQMSQHIVAGVPSLTAWRKLLPYLRRYDTFDVVKV